MDLPKRGRWVTDGRYMACAGSAEDLFVSPFLRAQCNPHGSGLQQETQGNLSFREFGTFVRGTATIDSKGVQVEALAPGS